MDHLCTAAHYSPGKNKLSQDFVEGIWETLIALVTTAGICIGVISLAAHLNETNAVRSAFTGAAPAAPEYLN